MASIPKKRKTNIFCCNNTSCKAYRTESSDVISHKRTIPEFRLEFVCKRCSSIWIACDICKRRFGTNNNLHRIDKHFTEQHPSIYQNQMPTIARDISNINESSEMDFEDGVINSDLLEASIQDNVIYPITDPTKPSDCASESNLDGLEFNDNSRKFFTDQIREQDHGGSRGLVARAFNGQNSSELASVSETKYHILVLKLCNTLT